jgi:1-acyl-sn-glycerol-3-phosphate acyltransferase
VTGRYDVVPARHERWADFLFSLYLRTLLARDFHSVRLVGTVPALPEAVPLLVVANHGTWWDGFFISLFNTMLLGRKLHLMMLEEQLRRFPFFGRIGAFGIRQGHPRAVASSLRYAASLLDSPGNAVCIFPQGALTARGVRPLGFQRGLEKVVKMHHGEVTILPVAIRCEFLGHRKPMAFLLAGDPVAASPSAFPGMQYLERYQESLLDRLDSLIASGELGLTLVGHRRP